MNNNTIPIVFASDNNYIPYMATTMQSIMENADRTKQYIFYVLYQDIAKFSIITLKRQISLFHNFSIEFINVTEYFNKYELFISRHITVETYFRLLIPELLSEYQKVIYLDGDMICCTDIAALLEIDIGNNLLAAVRDGAIGWYYSKKSKRDFNLYHQLFFELKNIEEYFNAGLLILNIELFQKTTSTNQLLELAASRKWQLHDQDMLNYLAEGKTFFLPYSWNFMFNGYAKYLPKHLQNEYNEAEKELKIIHYTHVKPWNSDLLFLHSELFWKYAFKTPFIETIIERMKSQELITHPSLKKAVISNIKRREGIGIRFILINCVIAWLFRNRKNTKNKLNKER